MVSHLRCAVDVELERNRWGTNQDMVSHLRCAMQNVETELERRGLMTSTSSSISRSEPSVMVPTSDFEHGRRVE